MTRSPEDRDVPLNDSVLSPAGMVADTDVTERMLDHWVRSKAVWPATVQRWGSRRHNLWTVQDRDRLVVVAQVLEDLAELGVVKVPTGFVRRLWQTLLDADPPDPVIELAAGRVTIVLDGE